MSLEDRLWAMQNNSDRNDEILQSLEDDGEDTTSQRQEWHNQQVELQSDIQANFFPGEESPADAARP